MIHGSLTQAASHFVQRMLTFVTTLNSQPRNVLDSIPSAVSAARSNSPAPSLLPEVADSTDLVISAYPNNAAERKAIKAQPKWIKAR